MLRGMDILPRLPTVPLPTASSGSTTATLTFNPPLPANLQGKPLNLTVVQSKADGTATLQLPSGQQLTATVSPPLATGAQLNFTPPQTNLPVTTAVARLLPPPPAQSAPAPTPAAPVPAPAPQLTLTTPPQLVNTLSVPLPPNTLPPSPLAVLLPAATQLPAQLPPTATLVPTAPLLPNGTQPATLTLPQPATPGTPLPQPLTLPVTLATGQPLQPQQPIQLTLPANTPAVALPGQPQTVVLTTFTTSSAPLTPTPASTPAAIPTPLPAPASVQITLAPANAPATPQTAPQNLPNSTPNLLNATVLPQLSNPSAAPAGQNILLSNGKLATVQSPQPLPTGTQLTMEINPLNNTATVLRLQPASSTSQQLAQNHSNPPSAQPTPTQTLQAPPPPGTVLQGTISGQSPGNLLTLTITSPAQFQGQTLTVTADKPLPLGTTLTATIQQGGTAQITALTLPTPYVRTHALTNLAQSWPNLTQGLQSLQSQHPGHAAQLAQRIPQLGALLPTLLPYLDAIQRNAPDRAFGAETTNLLRALGVDLSPDVNQLHTLQQRNEEGWRGVLFPYVENQGENPRQGGFFWRRHKSEDEKKPASTRFVVELSLSQMGDVQLDGLLAYPELWLKLRRHTQAEPDFIEGLQKLVQAALEEFGLTGGIGVEVTPTFAVDPKAEILATDPTSYKATY